MKNALIMALGLLFSSSVLAGADHYIRKDGDHVQHLKISKHNGDVRILIDVDFEPSAREPNEKPCSAEIYGDAKVVADNELEFKKQAQGEAHYCELKIHLNGDEARIEQNEDCSRYFAGGFCRFGSEGKVLKKVQ